MKYRDLDRLDILPASFLDALQEFISSMASANFLIRQTGAAQLQIAAGTGDDQVSIGIMGRWRYVTAPVSVTIAGGAATYEIYVRATDNSFSNSPAPDTDNTDYSFALEARTSGTPAGLYRHVATAIFDGTRITSLIPLVGPAAQALGTAGGVPIGAVVPYAGSGDPPEAEWKLADGRLVDRTTYASFFGRVGHAYNGGADPGSNMVRLPDKRGRVSVGADNMGTAQGAASRLSSSNTRGVGGGAQSHQHQHYVGLFINAGAGNFVAIGDESHITSLGYTSVARGGSGAYHGGAGKRNAGAISGTTDPYVGDEDPFSDANTTYDAMTATASSMPPYEVDNYIVKIA